jgi:hypothetical protein
LVKDPATWKTDCAKSSTDYLNPKDGKGLTAGPFRHPLLIDAQKEEEEEKDEEEKEKKEVTFVAGKKKTSRDENVMTKLAKEVGVKKPDLSKGILFCDLKFLKFSGAIGKWFLTLHI